MLDAFIDLRNWQKIQDKFSKHIDKPVSLIDENGEVKNLKGKFEPNANIVSLPSKSAETNKITVIMQKDKSTGKPTVLTIFPGENAPAFPAKINSESYKASTLGNTQETRFWKDHAFIQQT